MLIEALIACYTVSSTGRAIFLKIIVDTHFHNGMAMWNSMNAELANCNYFK